MYKYNITSIEITEVRDSEDVSKFYNVAMVIGESIKISGLSIHGEGNDLYVSYPENIMPLSNEDKNYIDDIIFKQLNGKMPLSEGFEKFLRNDS